MKTKLIILISTLLISIGCSDWQPRDNYDDVYNTYVYVDYHHPRYYNNPNWLFNRSLGAYYYCGPGNRRGGRRGGNIGNTSNGRRGVVRTTRRPNKRGYSRTNKTNTKPTRRPSTRTSPRTIKRTQTRVNGKTRTSVRKPRH